MNSLLPELPKGVFNSFGSPLLYDCIVKLKADEIGAQGDTVADATLLSGGTYISPNEAAKAADCIMAKLNRSYNETNGLLNEDERAAANRMEWSDLFKALAEASHKSLRAAPPIVVSKAASNQMGELLTSPIPVNSSLSNPPSSLPPASRNSKRAAEPKSAKSVGYKQKGARGSKYLGVYRCSKTAKRLPWTCAVSVGSGVQVTLQATETEEEAARLRDRAFYWLYGDHAKKHQMNFPSEKPGPLEQHFVEKLESRLVYAGLTRPALLHHDDEEEVVVALEDEDYEPNDAELEEVIRTSEERAGVKSKKGASEQPIELELLESLEQWLAPEGEKASSKSEVKRSHDSMDNGASFEASALGGGMEWLLGGGSSMMEFRGDGLTRAPVIQLPRKKARKAKKPRPVREEPEEEEEEEEEEPEASLQQMAAAEEIKCRLTEYLDYMRRAVKEVLPGYAKTYYPEGTEDPKVHYRMCSQCMQPTLKTVPCKKCRLNMREKEVELKKLEEGFIKVGMHSFLPIHEILLDAKSDHDLRFFPSMLRNNLAGKVTLESLAAGMGVGEVKEEGPRAPVAEGPAPEIAAAPNGQ